MSEQLKDLYELQKIDIEIAKVQKARASLDVGTSRKRQAAASKSETDNAEKLLHEATTELKDKELNLKTVDAKRKSYQDKLYAGKVTNVKELSSMEKEIEMLGRQADTIEERIIELMDTVEERKAELASKQETLKQDEEEYADHMAKARKKAAVMAAKMKELTAEREKAASAVNPALLARYEAMKGRLGGIGIARVEEGACGGCHMQISGNTMREIKSDQDIITCENCSRLLYLEHK